MLVLSRKSGEEIVIGNDVRVSVVSISGNSVKLAFNAPREVAIARAEIFVNDRSEFSRAVAAELTVTI